MGHFSYKAVEQGGEKVAGTIEAPDRRVAVELLAAKGHFVTELAEASHAAKAGALRVSTLAIRPTAKDILQMTNQLSTALRAGLPMLNALKIIEQQQHKPAMKRMMADLVDSVSGGQSLSEAMSKYPETFPPLYLSMIRVGETGGILEKTTQQLTSILQRDDKIKTSMKNAAAYPIFVLILGIASVAIIITFILPKILQTIVGGSTSTLLPWPTRLLLGVSDFFQWCVTTFYGWAAIILIIIGLWYLRKWVKTEGRIQWDAFKLRIPIMGSVLRTIAIGRFTRTLGSLSKGGVPILESLSIVRNTLGNELLGSKIDAVAEQVKTGSSLGGALGESGYFPPLLVQIVSIGEQTGQMDELLLNAADTFDEIADAAIARFMAVFPALLILMLALVIGFMIVAILMPIAQMSLGAGVF